MVPSVKLIPMCLPCVYYFRSVTCFVFGSFLKQYRDKDELTEPLLALLVHCYGIVSYRQQLKQRRYFDSYVVFVFNIFVWIIVGGH